MTEQARNRVTGAVFLIAIAAVGLPMLFDGAGIQPVRLPPVEVEAIDVSALQDVEPPPDIAPTLAARDALLEEIDDEGYRRDTGARHGEPTLADASAPPLGGPAEGWAVQMASFAQEAKAQELRDTLRADGYDAMLSNVKRDARKFTRVAVGPLLARADADKLKDELAGRYASLGLGEPRVVRFGH